MTHSFPTRRSSDLLLLLLLKFVPRMSSAADACGSRSILFASTSSGVVASSLLVPNTLYTHLQSTSTFFRSRLNDTNARTCLLAIDVVPFLRLAACPWRAYRRRTQSHCTLAYTFPTRCGTGSGLPSPSISS